MTHPLIQLTEDQHNALTGSMLGDGHLVVAKNNINAALMIGRSYKDVEYLKYEMSIFDNFLSLLSRSRGPKIHIKSYNGKYEDTKQCNFNTIASPSFTPYHKLWYLNKKKIVPNNLVLNGQIIAHWIADDASVLYNKLPYRFVVEFATNGFSEDEVNFLASLLKERYNEDFLVRQKNRKDKNIL